jgi:hypothetical protein
VTTLPFTLAVLTLIAFVGYGVWSARTWKVRAVLVLVAGVVLLCNPIMFSGPGVAVLEDNTKSFEVPDKIEIPISDFKAEQLRELKDLRQQNKEIIDEIE